MDGIILAALGVWSIMTLTWLVSIIKKNVSIVDIIYSLNFIAIALAYQFTQTPTLMTTATTACVTLWGLRLSGHLLYRNWGTAEDKRYQRFRENYGAHRYWWFSYFQVFMLQGIFAWVFAMPIHTSYFISTPVFEPILIAGITIFVFGFLYESIADYQLLRFKRQAKPNTILNSGLWRLSRHPNYFGEITLWLGLATIAASSLNPMSLFGYIGPISLALCIQYLSGSTQQEPNMLKNKPQFKSYQENTPNIIPKIF